MSRAADCQSQDAIRLNQSQAKQDVVLDSKCLQERVNGSMGCMAVPSCTIGTCRGSQNLEEWAAGGRAARHIGQHTAADVAERMYITGLSHSHRNTGLR